MGQRAARRPRLPKCAASLRIAQQALLAGGLLCVQLASGEGRVDVVLSGPGTLYTEVADSLDARLSRNPRARDLHLVRMQAGDPRVAGDAVLAVGVGMKACQSLLEAESPKPTLCALVPRAGFERLVGGGSGRRISAIYLDQPITRELALARSLLPQAQRVGLLAGPQLQREAEEIRRWARAAGFQADLEPVDTERESAKAIQRLVSRNDLILAAYDSHVLTPSTAKWLLHLAYQEGRPVLGFSRAYLDAGALAAVYSNPEQIGRQTAEAILDSFDVGNLRLPPSAFPRYFEVAVNRAVARALGLDLPSDAELMRRVEQLDKEGQ